MAVEIVAGIRSARLPAIAAVAASAVGGALVLIATRHDPLLSPDSVTYLAAADHLRGGRGLTDFTGAPMTVFGPVFPLLLSPGGRSLAWAATVTAVAVTVSTLLMYRLLSDRVRPWAAIGGALAFACAQGTVRVASTVWSEMPYIAIALAMLVVLTRQRSTFTDRRAALAGFLAGLGFLTRYAGVGLIATGAVVVVVVATGGRRRRAAALLYYGAAATITCLPWVLRNLIRTGEPLGPRFEGGSREPWGTMWRRPLKSIGELLIGPQVDSPERVGTVMVVVLAAGVAALIVLGVKGRRPRAVDVGIAAFAVTSFVVPVVARAVTSNDIESRVMSPMLVPIVFAAALILDVLGRWRAGIVLAAGMLALWSYQGLTVARDLPEMLPYSAASRTLYAPALYDAIDALPADATVLTNSPQRVWWQTAREPTLFAFTRPRPGNSHYPLDVDETLRLACTGSAHLAWFGQLLNAGDGPDERRPDLLDVVDLTLEQRVPGGELYRVTPRDEGRCRLPGPAA